MDLELSNKIVLYEIIRIEFNCKFQTIINLAHSSKSLFKTTRYVIKNANFVFDFYNTRISNNDLKMFRDVKNIDLSACSINDQGLINLCNYKWFNEEKIIIPLNATHMALYCCEKITDIGISYLRNTKRVLLGSTKITNNVLKYLTNCDEIDLSYCNISDKDLIIFNNMHMTLHGIHIDSEMCKTLYEKGIKITKYSIVREN